LRRRGECQAHFGRECTARSTPAAIGRNSSPKRFQVLNAGEHGQTAALAECWAEIAVRVDLSMGPKVLRLRLDSCNEAIDLPRRRATRGGRTVRRKEQRPTHGELNIAGSTPLLICARLSLAAAVLPAPATARATRSARRTGSSVRRDCLDARPRGSTADARGDLTACGTLPLPPAPGASSTRMESLCRHFRI